MAAWTFEIVEEGRLAIGRRLGNADIPRDDSLVDLLPHELSDIRDNLPRQVVARVIQFMGEKVYQTVIPRNVRISEAPSYGKPALLYDLKCQGSQAYVQLASEIIQREKTLALSYFDARAMLGANVMRQGRRGKATLGHNLAAASRR